MLPVSDAFRTAVAQGKPQRALLEFTNGAYVTNADISITSGGLHYDEVLNGETELTIGACPSAQLTVALVNADGWLNDFSFGQFIARLGAQTVASGYTLDGNVQVQDDEGNIISGHDDLPYLRINGTGVEEQPAFPVRSLVLNASTLYFFGPNNERGSGEWFDGVYTDLGEPYIRPNAERKIPSLVKGCRGLVLDGDTHIEYTAGVRSVWEYVPLGVFTARRPSVVRTKVVQIEASDDMSKFDVPMPVLDESLFPMTIGDLLSFLAKKMRVNLATKTFLNSDLVIPSKPDAFADATAREVLGWIAQAACSYARVSRTYFLELVWFAEVERTLTPADYSEFTPCEYEVAPVLKVQVRNADSDAEDIAGDGDNTYLIQDNPLLKVPEVATFSTETPASLIYERLNAFQAFHPINASTFCDWSLQSGDVIQITSPEGKTYRTPIYSLSLDWQGASKIDIESTGSETRPPVPKQQRQNFSYGRGAYGAKREAEELKTWAQLRVDEHAALIVAMAGRLDEVEGDYSSALVRIDGMEAEIEARVEKNGVIAAINMSAEEGILIQAEKIDLKGYVTMSDFEAFSAEINNITSGLSIVTLLCADRITVDNLEASEATITNLTVPASGRTVLGGTIGLLSGSALTIPSAATLNLYGYKTVWKKTTVATGSPSLSTSKRYLNLMLADGSTTGYIDIVTGVEVSQNTTSINYVGRES